MIDARKYLWITLAIFALGIGVGLVAPHVGCTPDEPPVVVVEPVKPDTVVYVYEQRDGSVPSAIAAALDKLNRDGINASPFDQNTTDGDGETPDQYKAALKAATDAGLPALVVLAGDKVLKVVKVKTAEEVLEAAK